MELSDDDVMELSDDDSPPDDRVKPQALLTEYFEVVEKLRRRGRPKGTKNRSQGNVWKRRKTEAVPAPTAAEPQHRQYQPQHQLQHQPQSGARGKTKTNWAELINHSVKITDRIK